MKVLVTGANGFLGAWVTKALVQENYEVVVLVRKNSDRSDLEGLNIQYAIGDVTDPASLEKAFVGIDSVFHLAGVVAYKKSQRALMERVNIDGTKNVVEACRKNKVRRLVHLSSVTAIGAGFSPDEILNENSPFNLGHLNLGYFETKRAAEEIVKEAVWRGDIDAVILNPSTIYGPADAKKGSRKTQIKVAKGEFPYFTNGGVNVIAVQDCVEGILAGWKRGKSGERYILSGQNLYIKELFYLISEAAGQPPPSYRVPNWIVYLVGLWGELKEKWGKESSLSLENARVSTMYHWFDNAKARRELGLIPRPAKDAIASSVEWMKEQGILKK